MQRNASKLAALAAVAIASLVYSGVQGEARQAPQQGTNRDAPIPFLARLWPLAPWLR